MKDRNARDRVPPPPERSARGDRSGERRSLTTPSLRSGSISGKPPVSKSPDRDILRPWLDEDWLHPLPLPAPAKPAPEFPVRNAPPMPVLPVWVGPAEPHVAPATDRWLDLPMVCARDGRAFILQFQQKCASIGASYRYERTLTEIAGGAGSSAPLTVPISAIDFRGIKCPFCRSECGPILCGHCKRLACRGSVRTNGGHQIFTCPPPCGTVGELHHTLTSVFGSKGQQPSRPVAFCAPDASPADVLRLPKPR
jgi:hypothetical protein